MKQRILLLTAAYRNAVGGIERSLQHMARCAAADGHEVSVMTFDGNRSTGQRAATAENITLIEMPRRRFLPTSFAAKRIAYTAKALRDLDGDLQPDLIVTRHIRMAAAVLQACSHRPLVHIAPTAHAFTRQPALTEILRGAPDLVRGIYRCITQYPVSRRQQRDEEALLRSNANVIAFSQNVQRGLIAHREYGPSRVRICRPGLDRTTFAPADASRCAALRRELGISPTARVAVYCGRLAPEKQPDLLLEAFASCAAEQRHLLLIGSGLLEPYLRRRVQRLGLSSVVTFAGRRDRELPGLYSLARVNVVPTFAEGFGHTHLEALACGTPSIGFSNHPPQSHTATEEIVGDMTDAIVTPLTPHALAAAMDRFMGMPDAAWQDYSTRARTRAAEFPTWAEFTRNLLALPVAGGNRNHHP